MCLVWMPSWSKGTGMSHGSIGKKPQTDWGGKCLCCPTGIEAGGAEIGSNQAFPPACLQQELQSKSSPGLEAMLG